MDSNISKDIVLFEELAANAHVALNEMQYDGWILRFSEGHTCRSNSVSMIYPSSLDFDEKIEYCEKIYSEQNLPCIFKLTDCDNGLMNILVARGYKAVTPSFVMTRNISDVTMPDGDITFCDKPVDEWLEPYFSYEGFGEKSRAIYRRMLQKVCVNTKYVAIKEDGKIIAVASSATERGYMLIQNVVVHPDYRRKGYGKSLCEALMAKGKDEGANIAWLQVIIGNIGAYKLYENLGFQKVYSYRYLREPDKE